MLVQNATRELELGLLLLTLALLGLVSYWVYRDAEARGMEDAAYWGAAVGVAFVVGLVVGGLVAVGVYRSTRPETYEGGQAPFDDLDPDRNGADQDPAHADLPPVPELTESRVEQASDTAIRGYARRYDDLDATGDPARLRAALRELVARGEAEQLVTSPEEGSTTGGSGDPRRHVGRPGVRGDDAPATDGGTPGREETDTETTAEFEWVSG